MERQMKNDNISFNISIYEVILFMSIIVIIVGIIITFQTHGPGEILIFIGSELIFGYITHKILPEQKGAFAIGLAFGIFGIFATLFIKINNSSNKSNLNQNKYKELEKLSELKQKGIISNTEFEKEKQKLLK